MQRVLAAAVLAVGASTFAFRATAAVHDAVADFTDLSLEQLMTIEVTSAARRPESVLNTPAAIYVLTNEDIRRMGARSIPEALRFVPGLNVAQISANSWAVTARGFNGRYANKLLVLMDGRTLYTPLFSGVYWNRQDTLLEDVERIEVIRGPGAALWGSNAVNGVINIITKNARDTQGGLVEAGVGTNDEARGSARYGGALGEYGYYRVFGKAFTEGNREESDGGDGADDWRSGQGGFRIDVAEPSGDTWELQAATYGHESGDRFTLSSVTAPFSEETTGDSQVVGSYLLGGWSRNLDEYGNVQARAYFQREAGTDKRLDETRDIADVEATHRVKVGNRHEIVSGVGVRYTQDSLEDSFKFGFNDLDGESYQLNAFIQDTIKLLDEQVELTVGSKFEYNNYTGLEVQPNVRALWHVSDRHTSWAAVSRAVRTPSRAEDDVIVTSSVSPPAFPGGLPTALAFVGNEAVVSEELLALEAGHRWQTSKTLSFDVSGFYFFYDRLGSVTQTDPSVKTENGTPYLFVPFEARNDGEADVYGFEAVGNWQPFDSLRLQGWYAYLQTDEGSSTTPEHQAAVRSLFNVTPTVTFDSTLRFVSELEAGDIDAYAELGVRLAWSPVPNLELAIAGQNLLRDRHQEFGDDNVLSGSRATQVERSIYGSVTLKF